MLEVTMRKLLLLIALAGSAQAQEFQFDTGLPEQQQQPAYTPPDQPFSMHSDAGAYGDRTWTLSNGTTIQETEGPFGSTTYESSNGNSMTCTEGPFGSMDCQ